MNTSILFILNSIVFGVGLAMDAFSISIAAGLAEANMKKGRMALIAGTFGGFQILMPLAGWFCVHTVAQTFTAFQKYIPWIAFLLLGYIGGKMLLEGISACRPGRQADSQESAAAQAAAPSPVGTYRELLILGIATAIDALSVGFTIAELSAPAAAAESVIIGIVTFAICWCGLTIGKKAGARLSDKAAVLGGAILVLIGIEILAKALFS